MQQALTYPQQYQRQGLSNKEIVIYSLLAVGGVVGLVVVGKKVIDKYVSNKAHGKSFEDGTYETYAKQIKMAFENDGYFGTDMDALRAVMSAIKSKEELHEVYKAYRKEYEGRNMYQDMSNELQASEYNEMLQIIAGKTQAGIAPSTTQFIAWAKRLKAAFDKTYSFIPGTDEPAIKAVFTEIPTQAAFINVGKEYQKLHGDDIITALKGELEIWEYGEYMSIILAKPKS